MERIVQQSPVVETDNISDQVELVTADEAPWTPIKTKPTDPGIYECQFKKLPAWPWPPTEELTWNGKDWLNDDGAVVRGIKEWRNVQKETA
jgi:hypothetical protein